jgi:hypothetical protein
MPGVQRLETTDGPGGNPRDGPGRVCINPRPSSCSVKVVVTLEGKREYVLMGSL